MKWFKKEKKKHTSPRHETVTRGLLIFSNTGDVMSAEQVLKEENFDIKVVSPPPQYRTKTTVGSSHCPMAGADSAPGK